MGITLVATSIVHLANILTHIGLASIVVIVPIEFHSYVSLTIVVTVETIIAVVIVATSATI